MANEKDPAGQDDPRGAEGPDGAKGTPDLEAANKRLNAELKAANERAGALQEQVDALTESLGKALTEKDVEAAVAEVKAEAEKAAADAKAEWEADRLRLTVENALVAAGCTDTVGCMAHLDLSEVEVASDGHLSGLDCKALAGEHPHLFASGGNTASVASAAAPGGPAKKMTKEEIMAEKDPGKRRKLISENMGLFE